MSKKRTRKKSTKAPDVNKLGDAMGVAIARFLDAQGWISTTVGPCEIRVGTTNGDNGGWTLAQYEFIAKFYGKRRQASGETAGRPLPLK